MTALAAEAAAVEDAQDGVKPNEGADEQDKTNEVESPRYVQASKVRAQLYL